MAYPTDHVAYPSDYVTELATEDLNGSYASSDEELLLPVEFPLSRRMRIGWVDESAEGIVVGGVMGGVVVASLTTDVAAAPSTVTSHDQPGDVQTGVQFDVESDVQIAPKGDAEGGRGLEGASRPALLQTQEEGSFVLCDCYVIAM